LQKSNEVGSFGSHPPPEKGNTMKYDWEKEIDLETIIEVANLYLPDHLSIIGVAVANTENVEACLKVNKDWIGNRIDRMDVMSE
jgi:hypothetical protein